ncbi:MAG: recombinase family protein [Cetobacterium sp.]
MRKYLYVRVSTKEQNEERQLVLKEKYKLRDSDVFIDKATGKNFDRPQYQALKSEIQTGDTLIIKSIDRLGRNKQQALDELRELQSKGVRIIVEDIPTTQIEVDEKNKLMVEMINNVLIEVYTTLAEEELNRTKQRQTEGYSTLEKDSKGRMISKKKNKVIGRTNKQENLSKEQERYVNSWLSKSIKLADCIKSTGLSRATLYRIKAREEKKESQNQ